MCTRGPLMVRRFASNACGCILRTTQKRVPKFAISAVASPAYHRSQNSQIFCKEAIMWKHLSHPNIVPLLGVTIIPFQLISSWMTGGTLLEYIKTNPNADRLGLVGAPTARFRPTLTLTPGVRRRQGPPLPSLLQRDPRGPKGSM